MQQKGGGGRIFYSTFVSGSFMCTIFIATYLAMLQVMFTIHEFDYVDMCN